MLGPKQQQLASYVAHANPDRLELASQQWRGAQLLLRRLAEQLESRATQIGGPGFSGATANATKTALGHSVRKMHDRADQLQDGSDAFWQAASAVRTARRKSQGFAQHSGDQPPQQPPDRSDVKAQHAWQTQNTAYWKQYADREGQAGDAISSLQSNHQRQAAVFARIHGETPPDRTPAGGDSPQATAGPSPYRTHVPDTRLGTHPSGGLLPGGSHSPGPQPQPGHTHHPGPHGGSDPTPPGGPSGTEQGPHPVQGVPLPGGPGPLGSITPTSSPAGGFSTVGGLGAVAGGALGGAAAAGLAGGLGVNGGLAGLLPAGGVDGSLSASGVRGIGATTRVGAGSVLGRNAGEMETTERMAGAGGSGGRSAGSRPGSRGAGAGAAGRQGKDKKKRRGESDQFDDGADWVDDEDVAPALLD